MITVRQRNGKKKQERPTFIHGQEDAKGHVTDEQVAARLLEDIRNVMESMLLETRRVRDFLEEAVKLAKGQG